ncbi:MAG: hypothetical protein K6A76_04460, partial [Oribacterium sp.]|nr:hypothetical protein [Oribacterium sp.]
MADEKDEKKTSESKPVTRRTRTKAVKEENGDTAEKKPRTVRKTRAKAEATEAVGQEVTAAGEAAADSGEEKPKKRTTRRTVKKAEEAEGAQDTAAEEKKTVRKRTTTRKTASKKSDEEEAQAESSESVSAGSGNVTENQSDISAAPAKALAAEASDDADAKVQENRTNAHHKTIVVNRKGIHGVKPVRSQGRDARNEHYTQRTDNVNRAEPAREAGSVPKQENPYKESEFIEKDAADRTEEDMATRDAAIAKAAENEKTDELDNETQKTPTGNPCGGILEVMPDGFGFTRSENFLP